MLTRCPNHNCNSTLFEMVLGEPRGSKFKVWFIQCAVCGAAINAMEYLSLGSLLDNIGKKVSDLEGNLSTIQSNLSNIEFVLRQITNKLR